MTSESTHNAMAGARRALPAARRLGLTRSFGFLPLARTILWMTAAASALSFVNADEVGNKNRKANKLYNDGKYAEAVKLYDDALLLDPSDGKLKMNKGSALYRMNELDEAEKSYLDALSSPINKKTAADAHYNLGNIQYKQGEQSEAKGDAPSARKKYSGALENYISALKLRPNDMDAKWNLQLAHQKIDMLKNQPEQNQDDQDDQDNQDNKDNQDKQQGGQGDKNDQDNKDQQDNQQSQDNSDQNSEDQQQEPEQKESDAKKEDAERLIEQYADDSDTLNKPRFQRTRVRQPEKDW